MLVDIKCHLWNISTRDRNTILLWHTIRHIVVVATVEELRCTKRNWYFLTKKHLFVIVHGPYFIEIKNQR